MLPKVIYRFNAFPIQIPKTFLSQIEKAIIKFLWIHTHTKKPQITKTIFRKNSKAGCITPPDFKIYQKATATKTVWYCYKNKHVDQWNTVESPERNPHIYSKLIFDKGAQNTQGGMYNHFSKWH